MKNLRAFTIIAAAFLIVLPAAAQHNVDVETTDDGQKKIVRIIKDGDVTTLHAPLKLTEEQQREFRKLDLQFKKETIELRNELDLKRLEKQVELEAENPDIKKLSNLIDAIHNLQAQLEKKKLAIELKKRELLTEEQRKSWKPGLGHKEEKVFMFKSGLPDDFMWFDHDEGAMPPEKIIEREVEIK